MTADAVRIQLAEFSQWIDDGPSYVDIGWEAHVHRRLAKVTEENGEVTEAWLGVLGENQRKGAFGSVDDVQKELLDVAVAALGAVEHLTGNAGASLPLLVRHIAYVYERAGLAGAS
jgi:NTP pyrophosphatase (non-canonical NTP hydrolase)